MSTWFVRSSQEDVYHLTQDRPSQDWNTLCGLVLARSGGIGSRGWMPFNQIGLLYVWNNGRRICLDCIARLE